MINISLTPVFRRFSWAIMDPNMMFPPYDDKYKKMVDDMLTKTVKVPDGVIKAINGVIKVRSIFSRR